MGRQPYHPGPRASQRGSKGSSRSRAHDSVMSAQPLSPKPTATSPPSPTASLHRTIPEIQSSSPPPPPLSYPPRAYLDPEKAAAANSTYEQPSPRASNQDVTAAIYDSGEYREKGPEDKPVQLLVCKNILPSTSMPLTMLSALPFWPLRPSLYPHRSLDSLRPPHPGLCATFPPPLLSLHQIRLIDHLPGLPAQSPTPSHLLICHIHRVQLAHARGHSSLLALRCDRRRHRSMDGCLFLVLFRHSGRSCRPGWAQRRQRKHSRRTKLVGAVALQSIEMITLFDQKRCERSILSLSPTMHLGSISSTLC